MADGAQIFNIRAPLSLERQQQETSNMDCAPRTMSSFDGVQKNYVKGDVIQFR